jgi:hypothetical protein
MRKGGPGLQVLVGLVEMYWRVNIMNISIKENHFKFSNLIFIKAAQVLVGLVEMYWRVNIVNKNIKENHGL